MIRSQNFQNLQNLFLWYGGTQPGCRQKAGWLAAFPLIAWVWGVLSVL